MFDDKKNQERIAKDRLDPRLAAFEDPTPAKHDKEITNIYELYRPMIEGRVDKVKGRKIIQSAIKTGGPHG